MPSKKYDHDEQSLRSVVPACRSFAAVLRFLHIPQSGSNQATVKRKILTFGIDTSHFTGQAYLRGVPSNQKKSADQILVLGSPFSQREDAFRLRRALIEIGVPEKCSECGVGVEWHGRKLTLEIDHKNGSWWDNRRDNLRFMCPNCHSQTETFGSKIRACGEIADPAG